MAGEVRGVRATELRVTEAFKMGFTTVVVPAVYRPAGGNNGVLKSGMEVMKSGMGKNGGSKNGDVKTNGGVVGSGGVVPCRSITEVILLYRSSRKS